MNCPHQTVLQQLLDEALPIDAQQTIQTHLETCPACQKTLERLAAGGVTWDKAAQNLADPPTRDETALADAVAKLQTPGGNPVQTQAETRAVPIDEDLSFLQPSAKPGSLGRLDKYEVLAVIGKGGFGIVLKAFDETLHRVVAIKIMSPAIASNGTARQRFDREAKAAAAVTHENVVHIYEVRGDVKVPYLVMQLVVGMTLNDKIEKQGALSVKEILRIGMQTAEGLAAAHKQGLTHRDIKPGNILLENGIERVKITDFGLARATDDASVTQSGMIAGTPMYMSPEQANGEQIDYRSDLFSLGSVLYTMCTGKPPFRAASTMAVMRRVCDDTPRPIRESNPEVPDWLADVVAKLHAKKPEERLQTAREVAELLGQRLADVQAGRAVERAGSVSDGQATPVAYASGSSRPRRRWRAALTVGALLSAIAVGIWYWNRPPQSPTIVSAQDLAGKWEDKKGENPWGRVFLSAKGPGEYVGTYSGVNNPALGPGKIHLRAIGTHTYEGKWEDSTQLRAGTFQMEMSEDGDRLSVRWEATNGLERQPVNRSVDTWFRVKTVPPSGDGSNGPWVQLFNGKDLKGWQANENWTVHDGALQSVNGEGARNLRSERDDFTNFHLRVEARINDGGNSGIFFRYPERWMPDFYEAQINTDTDPIKTGSLWSLGVDKAVKENPIKPSEWFTLEVIAIDNDITVKVNGKTTTHWIDPDRSFMKGALVLQQYNLGTIVSFRKIEIKELPLSPPPLAVAPFNAAKAKEHQEAWAIHLGVPVEFTNAIGMKFCLIPPGEYMMGRTAAEVERLLPAEPEDWRKKELRAQAPQQKVRIEKAFYLAAHEVTMKQFRRFVEATKYRTTSERSGNDPTLVWSNLYEAPVDDNLPVACVSVEDARAMCAWLGGGAGMRYDLPTDTQWEFACRAGTTTLWWFGDDEADAPVCEAFGPRPPLPVGSRRKNPFGLFDMHGNMREWAQTEDRMGVKRGGHIRNHIRWSHAADRQVIWEAEHAATGVGFRLAITGDLRKAVAGSVTLP